MDTMNLSLVFGSIFSFKVIGSLIGIRFRGFSAKRASLLMVILPFIFETIVVLLQGGKVIQIVCVGSLLSLVFGPTIYIFGRMLEKQTFKQKK